MEVLSYVTADRSIEANRARRSGYYTMGEEHSHDGYELYYLLDGVRDYFIRDRTYRVQAGEFVFIENGELHRTLDAGAPEHERIVFNIDASIVERLPLQAGNGVVRLSPGERWKGESIVRELLRECRDDEPGKDEMIEALLTQLLLVVFRAAGGRTAEETAPSAAHQTMSEIAAYVSAHCAEPLQLGSVADRFYVSPYYLSRTFKACTGFGFSEYVQLVRMREAQRLLRETDLKMIDVAERSGIGSVAGFHRLFKRMNGCSPLQYRKRLQERP